MTAVRNSVAVIAACPLPPRPLQGGGKKGRETRYQCWELRSRWRGAAPLEGRDIRGRDMPYRTSSRWAGSGVQRTKNWLWGDYSTRSEGKAVGSPVGFGLPFDQLARGEEIRKKKPKLRGLEKEEKSDHPLDTAPKTKKREGSAQKEYSQKLRPLETQLH